MTLQVSNKTKSQLAAAFVATFTGGRIEVYTGAQPEFADDAPSGTLLGTITTNGLPTSNPAHGLVVEQSGPYAIKPIEAVWRLTAIASGTAGWFRLMTEPDDGGPSYELARVDGAIGTTIGDGIEMVLPSTAITNGSIYTLDQFTYTIPPIIGV